MHGLRLLISLCTVYVCVSICVLTQLNKTPGFVKILSALKQLIFCII